LRHKKELAGLMAPPGGLRTRQGQSVGAVWVLSQIAGRLGITQALGRSRQGRLALWQVLARVIDQGSRLSAVRLAGSHAACDVLGIERPFNEEDLYENLDWLCARQAVMEKRLFEQRGKDARPELFLYDVTSSYLEGTENELGAFGYNRDGKRGKKQIVIGLLCDEQGIALSIEVFTGNTQDPRTVASQIRKMAGRFGAREITLVGDRGMLKTPQLEQLDDYGFHYITAITKAQIETLLKQGAIQMGLFDQPLAEVVGDIRYVLRRNPIRADELQASRDDKLAVLKQKLEQRNSYLCEHPRARVEVALRNLQAYSDKLRISRWVRLSGDVGTRELTLSIDEAALTEEAKLDGCYVLKTDLPPRVASKEVVHARYKDLALVEQAFRIGKTVELELRPIHVRLASRTRGHVFVVMLAYRIVQELAQCWRQLDVTVQEGLDELSSLCSTQIHQGEQVLCQQIPQPRPSVQRLLQAADIRMPEALPSNGVVVTTKRKLHERRKSKVKSTT
jgi:transposase